MKHSKVIYIGADPELFVRKDGEFVSGHNLLPGTKYAPFPVKDGAIQVDGTALEFNVEPCTEAEEFVSKVKGIMGHISSVIKLKDPKFQLAAMPVAYYTKDYFETIPDHAKELGCEPDYDAYTGKPNPKPDAKVTFRTGSGHIHIGWTEDADPRNTEHLADCSMTVRQLDSCLYPMSLLWDDDRTRRKLYGNIGAFRPKHYGAEYRVLSNAWLSDDRLMTWVFNATKRAMGLLEERDFLYNNHHVRNALKRKDWTLEELQHYHGFLKNKGFEPLPKEYFEAKAA